MSSHPAKSLLGRMGLIIAEVQAQASRFDFARSKHILRTQPFHCIVLVAKTHIARELRSLFCHITPKAAHQASLIKCLSIQESEHP